jgi:hypothetical protein
VELSDAENFPPVTDTSEAAWRKALGAGAARSRGTGCGRCGSAGLSATGVVPGKEGAHYNFYYMLHGVVQHELYHAGQIALLKKDVKR